jgi:hypothetical protein
MDVVDLREFYASRLGQATRRIIVHRLRGRLHGCADRRYSGLAMQLPIWTCSATSLFRPWR